MSGSNHQVHLPPEGLEVEKFEDEDFIFKTVDLNTPKNLNSDASVPNHRELGKLNAKIQLKSIDTSNKLYCSRENDTSTTRTEVSTEIDDLSVREKFSFYSANSFSVDIAQSHTHSHVQILPGNHILSSPGSATNFTAACEGKNSFGATSLLDLDEDDDGSDVAFERPISEQVASCRSMFINHELDTESRVGFYDVSDDDIYNFSSAVEDPPSCREKIGPSISCDEEVSYEFDWLSEETQKIEDKKKHGEKQTWSTNTCPNSEGFQNTFNAFLSRCVKDCFVPTNP